METRKVLLIPLALGGICFATGFYKGWRSFGIRNDSVTVYGSVTGYDSYVSKGVRWYRPVISFRPAPGEGALTEKSRYSEKNLFRLEGVAFDRARAYPVGAKVRLLYRQGDPKGAIIDSFFYLWGIPFAAAVAGLLFVGVYFVVLRIYDRFG